MSNSKYECGSFVSRLATLAILSSVTGVVKATDIEPRAYSNIPVGVNFLVAGYAYTSGSVSFPPPVPIENGKVEFHSAILAYSRSLDIWGRSGKVDFILPAAWISGEAEFLGEPRSRQISGLADPRARFYINLFGAPALSMKDFAAYRQNVIVGASLTVTAPGGQYDTDKLINVGSNHWSFKPEIGVSKAWGPLTTEVAAGAYLFTDNSQPFQGGNQQQDPLYTLQGHLIYSFGKGIWGAFDANYYTGGNTSTDGKTLDNRLESWRVGGTLALPVTRQHSIKLYGSTSIYSRIGSDFDIVGIAWQYRWGGGFKDEAP
ncbi:MAG: transporter [Methylosarcina sp.]